MWPNSQFPADLVTFTEEIPNGKLHFLSSDGIPRIWNSCIISFVWNKNKAVNK